MCNIIGTLVGNVPDLSRTCPIPWIWAWTGLFRGRGRRLACWVPCPGRVLVSESWVAPDHRPIFYLAKFVWQNKIFFFQSFLLKPALVLVHIIMVCVSTGANCMVWVTKKYACPLVSRTCPVPVLCPLVSTMGTALVPDMSRTCPGHVLVSVLLADFWTWDARTFPTKVTSNINITSTSCVGGVNRRGATINNLNCGTFLF